MNLDAPSFLGVPTTPNPGTSAKVIAIQMGAFFVRQIGGERTTYFCKEVSRWKSEVYRDTFQMYRGHKGIEARKPTPNPEIPKQHRVHANFL